jgi:hypothetical protein
MTRCKLILLGALVAGLAGCGAGGRGASPDSPAQLPLTPGAKVVAQARQCDRGANAYCALQLVVTDPTFKTSTDLVKAEQRLLHGLGWSLTNGDTGDERAAESPGHKLRVTYATAFGELRGIDLTFVHRSPAIALALSRAMFNRDSAMSLMLQAGAS